MAIDVTKVTFYVYRELLSKSYEDARYMVIFAHEDRKGKRIKAGILSLPYRVEYGIDVQATFDGEKHWARTGSTKELQQAMERLYEGDPGDMQVFPASEIYVMKRGVKCRLI